MERKTVLITGGARGIGFSTAQEFARAGYDLALIDRDHEGLEQAAKALSGTRVVTRVVDVGDQRAVEAMAQEVLAELGHLDVLVNNAGIAHTGTLASTPMTI